jgi:hypothetical protein
MGLHFREDCGRDGSYHKSVDSVYHNNAHLNEFPDYYTRLEKMEKDAKEFHNK